MVKIQTKILGLNTDCGLGSNKTAEPCFKALLHFLLKHLSFAVGVTVTYLIAVHEYTETDHISGLRHVLPWGHAVSR